MAILTNKSGIEQHNNCTMVIIDRYHKGKAKLIPGLYCENHACLIKWLTPSHAKELKQFGVEYLGTIPGEAQKAKLQALRRK
jgi:hypothetical protein